MGEDGNPAADMRHLASWRRLNEFRSDIENERKSIEMEAMRVENHINKLKESKQWLTDMSIKINAIGINTDFVERGRIIREFKGYLRKKIGLEKIQKADDSDQRHMFKNGQDGSAVDGDALGRKKRTATGEVQNEMEYERDNLLDRERNWLSKNLLPMTRI